MTYYVAVTNQTTYTFSASDGQPIAPAGGTWKSPLIGDAWVDTGAWGRFNFLDIGHAHVGGDGAGEWGVLFSYQGEEVVGRYDGSPTFTAVISPMGEVTLAGGTSLRQVSLPAFRINAPPTFVSEGDPAVAEGP
jgi:hypothetical protein